jgi:uncharacterized membrane protein YhaH (DUF805 family)
VLSSFFTFIRNDLLRSFLIDLLEFRLAFLPFNLLLWFIPSFEQVNRFGFFVLEIALLALFVVLVTVKGNPAPNRYGPLPGSRGSFFKRIFNV